MSKRNPATRSRAGFTLPEVLVAVAMVGVLAAVVLPTVIGQVGKGEISRVVQDLQAVDNAAQMFRTDVGRWPGDIEDVVVRPTANAAATDADVNGDAYSSTNANAWDGPYIGRGDVDAAGLLTGAGGTIVASFASENWNGAFFALQASGLSADEAEAISLAVDGNEGVDALTEGKARYDGTTLTYLASPLK